MTEASSSRRRVLVTGAAGFVGRHTCHALAKAGYGVIGLVRSPPTGDAVVPGVRYVLGDVTRPQTLSPDKFAGCDSVIHLVGIIAEVRREGQTFEAIHVAGTTNLLASAHAAGVHRFVYLSALGADGSSESEYSRTKARAEEAVIASGIPYTIFRPSIILGPDGEFVQQMEDLIKRPPLSPFPLPFIPVPGSGDNKFQPLWIGDLTACLAACLSESASSAGRYEIGGADQVTFNALIEAIERHVGLKKPLLHAPLPLMFVAASVLQAVLSRPPITVDQLRNLRRDNVCDNKAIRAAFGINPLPFEQALARVYAERK